MRAAKVFGCSSVEWSAGWCKAGACHRFGLIARCPTVARYCSGGLCCVSSRSSCFSRGISRGSSIPCPPVPGASLPDSSSPSVSPSGGFTRSSPEVRCLGAGIAVPHRDSDGRSSPLWAVLVCPSPAGPGHDAPSSDSVGRYSPSVDRMDASWKTLKASAPLGAIDAAFEGESTAVPVPTTDIPLAPAVPAVTVPRDDSGARRWSFAREVGGTAAIFPILAAAIF